MLWIPVIPWLPNASSGVLEKSPVMCSGFPKLSYRVTAKVPASGLRAVSVIEPELACDA